jgi:hypothetical protein
MTSAAAPVWPVRRYTTRAGVSAAFEAIGDLGDRGDFWPLQGHKSSTIVDHDLSREGHQSAYRAFRPAKAGVGRGVGG